MKKFAFLSLIAVLFMGAAFACTEAFDDRPVAVNELPKQITTFVEKHFAGVEISYAKLDKGLTSDDYEVVLANGVKIDFDSKGEWKEVDCERGEVPASIVPQAIGEYVKQHYSSSLIEKISRGRGYEVELNNDLELYFDKQQNFVRIDD